MKMSPSFIGFVCGFVFCLFFQPVASAQDAERDLTLESLHQRMEAEAAAGFDGAVLVVHDGEIVLEQGYGLANRAKNIQNNQNTIFATGSLPIDFTHVAILQLVERGKLDLSDPITKFFENVPEDKQSITVEYLRTGQSGLRDFHDLPSDKNPDHSWIDREEAVHRIMNQELLFKPGSGREHSHSAWGLLAAIVEIASGQSYQEYTTEHVFRPAGMNDTGFFGESFPEDRIAVGYGQRASSKINSPNHWGKTSWLVMGSGGQVSTVGDINRFMQAVHDRKLLNDDSVADYFQRGMGMASAGDMFGFELFYTQRPSSRFILTTNSAKTRNDVERLRQLAREIDGLLTPPRKFSLGIMMGVDQDQGVVLTEVMPGSAAENAGLKPGDQLVSVDGKELGADPMGVLSPYLQSGDTIPFRIIRSGETISIEVQPTPLTGQGSGKN